MLTAVFLQPLTFVESWSLSLLYSFGVILNQHMHFGPRICPILSTRPPFRLALRIFVRPGLVIDSVSVTTNQPFDDISFHPTSYSQLCSPKMPLVLRCRLWCTPFVLTCSPTRVLAHDPLPRWHYTLAHVD